MMLNQLDIQPGNRVLEIGAGTGYNASLLAELTGDPANVVTIDIDPDVTGEASPAVASAGYEGVRVVTADTTRPRGQVHPVSAQQNPTLAKRFTPLRSLRRSGKILSNRDSGDSKAQAWGRFVGGREAIRGFEYQFLCTLEYALAALAQPESSTNGIYVESPRTDGSESDDEAIDFALCKDRKPVTVVQVKGGGNSSEMSGPEALKILIRLTKPEAEKYILVVGKNPSASLLDLVTSLSDIADLGSFKTSLRTAVRRSEAAIGAIEQLTSLQWQRLTKCQIVLDNRSPAIIRNQLREEVRSLRHQLVSGPHGWDAAGLLLGHLLWDVLGRAAQPDAHYLTFDELKSSISVDTNIIAASLLGKSWLTYVNSPPRLTDIPRPKPLAEVADILHFPNDSPQVPVCVLSGLSGVGKTSIATAWAAERSDEYRTIIWVDASSAASVEHSFKGLDRWLDSELDNYQSSDLLLSRVQSGLSRLPEYWLIVFDNAERQSEIADWLPRTGFGHVIVTTTDQLAWRGPYLTKVSVPVMEPDEALQLLTARLERDLPSVGQQQSELRLLARRLQHWPLALELAAAYLIDCEIGLAGINGYEDLLLRALDDQESVPAGYPRTLVAGVLVAWQRMANRAKEADSSHVAYLAMAYLAFMHSRQIPFHLLMACVFLDPKSVVEAEITTLCPYKNDTIPAGEILRALLRDSLASVDLPIFGNEDSDDSVHSVGYSVSANEIVQAVIRRELQKQGSAGPIIQQLAFFVQHWLAQLLDANRIDLAVTILGQCTRVCELAMRYNVSEYTVALLWGNTASAFFRLEEWTPAERYLRAEASYLIGQTSPDPTMALATYVQLASVLTRKYNAFGKKLDEVLNLLELALKHQPLAAEINRTETDLQTVNACTIMNEISHQFPNSTRAQLVADSYKRLTLAVASDDPRTYTTVKVMALSSLVRAGKYSEVLEQASVLLADDHYKFHAVTILRFQLESLVGLRMWKSANNTLDLLDNYCSRNALGAVDATTLITNTAWRCVGFDLVDIPEAILIRERVLQLVERYRENERWLSNGDVQKIRVIAAYAAASKGDFHAAHELVQQIDEAELITEEFNRIPGADHLLLVVKRWLRAIPTHEVNVD